MTSTTISIHEILQSGNAVSLQNLPAEVNVFIATYLLQQNVFHLYLKSTADDEQGSPYRRYYADVSFNLGLGAMRMGESFYARCPTIARCLSLDRSIVAELDFETNPVPRAIAGSLINNIIKLDIPDCTQDTQIELEKYEIEVFNRRSLFAMRTLFENIRSTRDHFVTEWSTFSGQLSIDHCGKAGNGESIGAHYHVDIRVKWSWKTRALFSGRWVHVLHPRRGQSHKSCLYVDGNTKKPPTMKKRCLTRKDPDEEIHIAIVNSDHEV